MLPFWSYTEQIWMFDFVLIFAALKITYCFAALLPNDNDKLVRDCSLSYA